MRKIFCVAVVICCLSLSAFGSGYLEVGAPCVPGSTVTDTYGECAPGLLCFYDSTDSQANGRCVTDCALIKDEARMRDASWAAWGGLPLNTISAANGVMQLFCVFEDCLDFAGGSGCATYQAYVCVLGYYGKPAVGTGTAVCTACPSGGMSKIHQIGGFNIEDCYLPAGSGAQDETGTFTVSGDCYYSAD